MAALGSVKMVPDDSTLAVSPSGITFAQLAYASTMKMVPATVPSVLEDYRFAGTKPSVIVVTGPQVPTVGQLWPRSV